MFAKGALERGRVALTAELPRDSYFERGEGAEEDAYLLWGYGLTVRYHARGS